MEYYTQGVLFNRLEDILKIYKKQGRSLEEILPFFTSNYLKKKVNQLYGSIQALSVKEALCFNNIEQRMLAIRLFSPQELLIELNPILLDSQTIEKKQIRWTKDLKAYTNIFLDTYNLYKLSGQLLVEKALKNWQKTSDIYIVECKCTSTNKKYFLFVPPEVGENKDAIQAIAWTMQINGNPISKEQYLHLIYSET